MTLVITGALGYIGSSLFDRALVRRSPHVIAIDNRSAQPYCSSPERVWGAHVDLIEADIGTFPLEPLLSRSHVVVHLAAWMDATPGFEGAGRLDEVNVEGTLKVAEACMRAGAKLLFVSTTSVYAPHGTIVDEDCPATEICPQSPYAASKLRAEGVLEALGRKGLRCAVARFGSVFGPAPTMRLHTAVNRFCWEASTGRPIRVWRTALHQRRPYLHVTDAARAIEFIVQRDLFDNRVYNVVTVNTTVHDIVQVIRQHVPSTTVQYVDSSVMNDLSYSVGTERIRERGFMLSGNLELGIRDTLEVFHQRSRVVA